MCSAASFRPQPQPDRFQDTTITLSQAAFERPRPQGWPNVEDQGPAVSHRRGPWQNAVAGLLYRRKSRTKGVRTVARIMGRKPGERLMVVQYRSCNLSVASQPYGHQDP